MNFVGNTVYSDEELSKLSKHVLQKLITIDDVLHLAQAITQKYNYDGYITSLAFIPEQDVVDGKITIQIIESKVGSITMEGNKWARDRFIKNGILHPCGLREGKIFRVTDVDKSLKEFKKYNYLKSDIYVEDSGELEKTNIHLNVKDRFPITFNTSWDDYGRNLVGLQRATLVLGNENLTGFGDKVYGGTVLAHGTTGALAGYQIPISKYGTKLAFDYGYTRVKLGQDLKPYGIKGTYTSYLTRIIQPLYKSSSTEVEGSIGFDFNNSNSRLGLMNMEMSDYSLRVLRGNIYATHDDRLGRSLVSFNSDFGFSGLGATKQEGNNARTKFTKFGLNAIRLHRLPFEGSYLVMKLGGQYSPDPLYPIEQMQMGGFNSIRGYSTGVLIADYGYSGSIELRTPVPGFQKILPDKYKQISDRVKLVWFYDFGYLKEHKNLYNYAQNFMQGAGGGLNVYLSDALSLNLAVGVPLGKNDYKDGSARFYFSLNSAIDNILYRKFHKEYL